MKYQIFLMRIFLVFVLFISGNVYARMYQWTEPDTGSTQLSGKPPAWYRSAAGGPRVFVFDSGRLIDDTAVEVSDEIRQRMRQQAFVLAEEDRQEAKEKIAKAQKLKQKYDVEKPKQTDTAELDDDSKVDAVIDDELVIDDSSVGEEEDKSFVEKSVDELREMIADWEKSQTESAKEALEN
jgi:hypothetical protein